MPSLYAQYLKERTIIEIIENEQGFVTYSLRGKECRIEEFFTLPEARRQGLARLIGIEVLEIAKAAGCTHVTASVCTNAKNTHESLKAAMAAGLSIFKADQNLIWLGKEL